uniref:Uncharacterized protein n=1 Tax=Anguilla anguilla TaxID=7936 RepID=A0A0E9Q8N3_ANGAN
MNTGPVPESSSVSPFHTQSQNLHLNGITGSWVTSVFVTTLQG